VVKRCRTHEREKGEGTTNGHRKRPIPHEQGRAASKRPRDGEKAEREKKKKKEEGGERCTMKRGKREKR